MRRSIWFDESYSAYLTHFDFGKVWSLTAADVHPPLYYFALKTWAHFFGHTDFAMRCLSTIFGAIAIMFAFLWVKYKYGAKAAIVSSLLLSISPIFIRYGEEMRMYTMVCAIVFAATYFLQIAIDNGQKKWWVIYAILVALGMWTHYFTALAWLAHVVYLLYVYKLDFFKKKLFIYFIIAAILYLPWIPSLWAQVSSVEKGFWIGAASFSTIADLWTEATLYQTANKTNNWFLVLSILEFVTVLAIFIKTHKKMKLVSLLALVPIIALVLLSMPPLKPMFVSRYVIYSMICAAALAPGVGLVCLINEPIVKRKQKKVAERKKYALITGAAVILVANSITGIATVYGIGSTNDSNQNVSVSRELYEAIASMNDELPIVTGSVWTYYDLSFYSGIQNKVYLVDELVDYDMGSLHPLRDSYFGKIHDFDAFMAEHEEIWYIEKVSKNDDLAFPREGYIERSSYDLTLRENGDTYRVSLYQRVKL
jgi:4-amino-4-deoxy-L-arabinose transferase-like glycosyltransferase